MSLPAQDNFNRADSGTLGANWTNTRAGFGIVSNQAKAASDPDITYWSADSFNADQYSQLVITNSSQMIGPAVRVSAGTNSYLWQACTGGTYVYKEISAGFTSLGTTPAVPSNGQTARLEVEGTSIRCYINGVQTGTSFTDSALASGSAGLYGGNTGGGTGDDWEGGNLGAAPSGNPWHAYAQQ